MADNIALFGLMKNIHMITLAISVAGFVLRGVWMMKDSPLLKSKLVRVLPHVNDTILLISAVWAGSLIGQYPFVNGWLTAKILGAIAYIVFGALALSYGRTKQTRIRFFVLALLCLSYVMAVAATRNPLPFI